MSAFTPETLERISDAREIDLETSRTVSAAPRLTTIWVVVDAEDRVLVRSVRGERGRWYRDLVANPQGVLVLGAERIGFAAVAADDAERVAACSAALSDKYARAGASLAAMLMPETLDTTLELVGR